MFLIDLRDGFFQILIYPKSNPFLLFMVNKSVCQFESFALEFPHTSREVGTPERHLFT